MELLSLIQNDAQRPFLTKLSTGRQLVEQGRRAPEDEPFPTMAPALDRILGGGVRRGVTVELVGGRSSGRFSLALAALAAVTGRGEPAALIDLGDSLDPRGAAELGLDLEHLLWIRPKTMKQALASAEIVLSSGIPFVAMDLGMPPLRGGRGAEAAWLRLARLARKYRAALLVATPYRACGTAAQEVVRAQAPRATWRGRGLEPRLLAGLGSGLELLKSRLQRPGRREAFALAHGEDLGPSAPQAPSIPLPQNAPSTQEPPQLEKVSA